MTTRQSRRRARVLSAGGMQLSVLLGREAAVTLDEVQARTGETQAAIVERALQWAADPANDPPRDGPAR
mgnify:FL=1